MLTLRASSSSGTALLLLAMGWISAGELSLARAGRSRRWGTPLDGWDTRCGELALRGRAPASSGLLPADCETPSWLRPNRLHSMPV